MKLPTPAPDFWTRRRWLARLSFSFLIVAILLLYTAVRGAQSHAMSNARATFYLFVAAAAFVLFLMGTREKHRPRDRGPQEPP